MDLRRLRVGEWTLATSGGALIVSLFLPWYAALPGGPGEGRTGYAPVEPGAVLTGWESFAAIDIVLALIAASAAGVLVITATQAVPAVPLALDGLVTLAGIAATVLIVVRALSLPDAAAAREWALWLGLAGALGIVLGGAVAMRDERLSPPARHTDHTGLPAAPPAEIETLPAPPALPASRGEGAT